MSLSASPGRATLAAALVVLAACADAPAPVAPIVPSADLAGAPACGPGSVQRLVNSLYPGGTARADAHRNFNEARQDSRFGRTAEATAGFLGIAGDAVTRYLAGELLDPRGPTTTRQGVGQLADRLFACAGLGPVSGQLPPPTPPGGAGLLDLVVAAVLPGQAFDVRTPSDRFAVTDANGDFLDEPALLVMYRIPDAPPFAPGVHTEYPPRYRVDVLPYTAHENFDNVGPLAYGPEDVITPSAATAVVSICPNDVHPAPPTSLRVLRRPEPFLLAGPHLLPSATPAPLTCEGNTQAPGYALGGPAPASGVGRFLASVRHGLRQAGSRALALLGPTPLYAVDGGAGGGAELLSDFVAAAPPLFLFAAAPDGPFVEVPGSALAIADGAVRTLRVSTTSGTLTPAAGCTWAFRRRNDDNGTADIEDDPLTDDGRLTALAPGSTRVRATCSGGTLNVPVTVTPVEIIGD